MASEKLSNLVDLAGGQVPADLAYVVDVSAGLSGSKKSTLNNLFSEITKNITDGAVRWGGFAAPTVSAAGKGAIYFDSTSNTFKGSRNASAYANLLFGTGTSNQVTYWGTLADELTGNAGFQYFPSASPEVRITQLSHDHIALNVLSVDNVEPAHPLARFISADGFSKVTITPASNAWTQDTVSMITVRNTSSVDGSRVATIGIVDTVSTNLPFYSVLNNVSDEMLWGMNGSGRANTTVLNVPRSALIEACVLNGLYIVCDDGSINSNIYFVTGSSAQTSIRLRIDATGSLVQGVGALATTATDGFFYLNSMAGTPTGNPATTYTYTGRVPLTVDTSNSRIYGYIGGAWTVLSSIAAGSTGAYQINNGGSLGAGVITQGSDGRVVMTPTAVSSGSTAYVTITAPADTGLTASTEAIGINFNGSATRQHATGAITTQREFVFQAPTYSFVGASTITNAATVAISGRPLAGTNATLTNPYALWIQSNVNSTIPVLRIDGALAASTTGSGILVNGNATGGTNGTDGRWLIGWFDSVGFLFPAMWAGTNTAAPTQSNFFLSYNQNSGADEPIFNGPGTTGTISFRTNNNFTTPAIQIRSSTNGQTVGVNMAPASIAAQIHVLSGAASRVVGRFDSAASPSVDILQATINASTTAGAYFGIKSGGTIFGVRAAVTATSGGTTTLDLNNGNWRDITMPAGNTTIALSNIPNSALIAISITQDATGSRTVTWPSTIKWAGGAAPTLTTTANARDQFLFTSDGTNLYECGRALNVS